MAKIVYIANELKPFEQAMVWKNYYGGFLNTYLKGKVLEVGAGIGSTTQQLCNGSREKWLCLEPDPELYSKRRKKIIDGDWPPYGRVLKGTTACLPSTGRFNSTINIDAIENIEKVGEKLPRAESLVANGVYLIVLVPVKLVLRPDLSAQCHKQYLDDGGFNFMSFSEQLLPGTYRIGLAIENASGQMIYEPGLQPETTPTPDYIKN